MDEKSIANLGEIAIGKVQGRQSEDERILFVTSGMPVEDVGWGFELYTRAKKMGLGQMLKIWDSAHWM